MQVGGRRIELNGVTDSFFRNHSWGYQAGRGGPRLYGAPLVGLGQGVYRGDYHVEGEVWDVSHPTRIVDSNGRSFEFDHAWAENFTRLTCDGQRGLAHFECVVILQAQEWTANPGRTPAGGSHE